MSEFLSDPGTIQALWYLGLGLLSVFCPAAAVAVKTIVGYAKENKELAILHKISSEDTPEIINRAVGLGFKKAAAKLTKEMNGRN